MQPPTAEDFQVILSAERFRGIESVFEPNVFGADQAGIIEIIESILRQYDPETRKKLVSNVFVTGGFSQIKNLGQRLQSDLRSIVDVDWEVVTRYAEDPMCDAWKGASMFCREQDMSGCWVTRKDYDEKGQDYLKEHCCSNVCVSYSARDTLPATSKRKKYI